VKLYLPIKSYWLRKIISGEKRIEYQEATPYWENRFKKQYSEVVFHQYRGALLRVRVKAIRKVPTPPRLTLIKTKTCFAISLGEILETA